MKKLFFLLLLAAQTQLSFSQPSNTGYKVVPLITKESFYLNGGARAAFGGKSRTFIMVTLPPNTVEWYYAVTTTPKEAPPAEIGLAGQLIKYLTPGGIASSVLSSLIAPTGAGVCDMYLFSSQPDLNRFLAKQEPITSLMSAMRENFRQGVVQIRDATQGTYYLAMRNPSGASGINITIEATAIVKE